VVVSRRHHKAFFGPGETQFWRIWGMPGPSWDGWGTPAQRGLMLARHARPLWPGIHVLLFRPGEDVDGRDRPGHDGRAGRDYAFSRHEMSELSNEPPSK